MTCHAVSTKQNEDVTNVAIAISAKDFYEQYITEAKSQGIQEQQTPSYRDSDFSSGPKIHIPIWE